MISHLKSGEEDKSEEIENEIKIIKKNLDDYQPGSTLPILVQRLVSEACQVNSIHFINILLFGYAGSGKTSLTNKLLKLFHSELIVDSYSVPQEGNLQINSKILKSKSDKFVTRSIKVVDHAGFNQIDGNALDEIRRQCDAKVLSSSNCNEDDKNTNSIFRSIKRAIFESSWSEGIGVCPVIAHRIGDEKPIFHLRLLVNTLFNCTGVFPIVAIILDINDTSKQDTDEDLSYNHMLRSKQVLDCKNQFKMIGINRFAILLLLPQDSVYSATSSKIFKLREDLNLLLFLLQCCRLADANLKHRFVDQEPDVDCLCCC